MKAKTVFFCTECGSESPRWSGVRRMEFHGGAGGGASVQKQQNVPCKGVCKGISHYGYAGGRGNTFLHRNG